MMKFNHLTVTILKVARRSILNGHEHYICHAVNIAGGRPRSDPRGGLEKEVSALLDFLGIATDGAHFQDLLHTVGITEHNPVAKRLGRLVALDAMIAVVRASAAQEA